MKNIMSCQQITSYRKSQTDVSKPEQVHRTITLAVGILLHSIAETDKISGVYLLFGKHRIDN